MIRFLLYFLGGVLVLAGIIAVAFQSGADELVPNGVIWAIVLVLVGILVIGLSSRAPEGPPPEEERVVHHEHRGHRHDH